MFTCLEWTDQGNCQLSRPSHARKKGPSFYHSLPKSTGSICLWFSPFRVQPGPQVFRCSGPQVPGPLWFSREIKLARPGGERGPAAEPLGRVHAAHDHAPWLNLYMFLTFACVLACLLVWFVRACLLVLFVGVCFVACLLLCLFVCRLLALLCFALLCFKALLCSFKS